LSLEKIRNIDSSIGSIEQIVKLYFKRKLKIKDEVNEIKIDDL
jgi:hypothetical protein